jgi:hypothetical protein
MLSEEYKNNTRMSQSKLKRILEGVEEFKYALDNPPETTHAMNLGQAVHLLVLQPHLSERVGPMEKFDRRTKEGKESFLRQQETIAQFPDNIFLSMEDFEKANRMAESVRKNSDAVQILSCCESFEQSHYFDLRGIPFKCQTDGVGSEFVLDLKTTRCPNNEYKIRQEIMNNGYHYQAAAYLAGTGKTDFYFIFVRNEPPYAVFPVKLSQDMLDQGRWLLDDSCELYKKCLRENPEFKADNKLVVI